MDNADSLAQVAPLPSVQDIESEDLEVIDSTLRINYWRVSEITGEILEASPDTLLGKYHHRSLVEGQGTAMAYLGSLGLPAESRIYFERAERTNFMFVDPYRIYSQSPGEYNFINTKMPYSNFSYQSGGGKLSKEERLKGNLALNFGKKISLAFDVDYLYARGFYTSQAAKRISYILAGSYIDDKHQLHVYLNPAKHNNGENGGIENDLYITDPGEIVDRSLQTREIPTRFQDTWNKLREETYFLSYKYNLGADKLSSISYSFNYQKKDRLFYSNDSIRLDSIYGRGKDLLYKSGVRDSSSYWNLKNSVAISLREGSREWAKFGLTAFLTQEVRSYSLMDKGNVGIEKNEASTFVGGEINKRRGKVLRYDAFAEFGLLGKNIGNLKLKGNVQTRIPILKDTASLSVSASLKNLSPSFYENNFASKYLNWQNDFGTLKKVYIGGALDFPQTKSQINIGLENITNYIFFDDQSLPSQFGGNIQVFGATWNQQLSAGALHWENNLSYQKSSEDKMLPLPDLSLFSNLFVQFKVAEVLTIQLGSSLNYFTKYYSPTYEPLTQQFGVQNATKIGNYPLVNAYANCHLKYTRFFIEFYNISSSFISNPEYFSIPHYPINPQIFKFGISWDFSN
ncbi:hypothetical protein AwDysgo_13960 [Bacteroidales bacterium]|nr:hypothetical protein AwDysgo_13960 [Bacteroidales bacterium]